MLGLLKTNKQTRDEWKHLGVGVRLFQGRSLFSLKTLKIPDLFSFFSFFFSPVFEIFRAGLTLTFRFLGNRGGLMVCPRAQRAEKLSDGLKKSPTSRLVLC